MQIWLYDKFYYCFVWLIELYYAVARMDNYAGLLYQKFDLNWNINIFISIHVCIQLIRINPVLPETGN